MPIDIHLIRTNPQLVRESQTKRFGNVGLIDEVIELDNQWKVVTNLIDNLNRQKNLLQKEVTVFYKAKTPDLAKENLNQIAQIEIQTKNEKDNKENLSKLIKEKLSKIGNIVAPDVVVSKDEDADNQVIKTWGTIPQITNIKNHHTLLWKIGGFEPERGTKISGHKGYFLTDVGVMLNQAVINYSINFLRTRQYKILQPPYFMKKDVMAGVAQLEEFDESLYHVGGGDSDAYLIATSEQPICAYHKDEWLNESELPKMYGGLSTCFRKEAGAHGKDVWGIFRVHQFDKVEQFAICEDSIEKSDELQKQMLQIAEEFYQSLGIPYRVVSIVSGALNNAAIRKYDLEGWFPGYEAYRELVSCSNCTDYQSRAMEIRCGTKKDTDETKRYVHMLNSTLCACTRVICCILELNQTETGIKVPDVLKNYMGGMDFIPFVRD
jgi:seryl-tRNA synthetase